MLPDYRAHHLSNNFNLGIDLNINSAARKSAKGQNKKEK